MQMQKKYLNSYILNGYFLFIMGLLGYQLIVANVNASDLSTREADEFFFHQSFNNLQEELEIAQEEGNLGVFVMFNDMDCPWCAKMKATVLNQVAVQEYYRRHFRVLHIDTRGDTLMNDFNGAELSEKDFSFKVNRVRATPVFMFFDLKGQLVKRYTGTTQGMQEFLWLAEYVVKGVYKTKNFSQYKRERRAQGENSAHRG